MVVFANPLDEIRIVFAAQDVMIDNAIGTHFARWTPGAAGATQGGFGRLGDQRTSPVWTTAYISAGSTAPASNAA
jgi:hypothetical protein